MYELSKSKEITGHTSTNTELKLDKANLNLVVDFFETIVYIRTDKNTAAFYENKCANKTAFRSIKGDKRNNLKIQNSK